MRVDRLGVDTFGSIVVMLGFIYDHSNSYPEAFAQPRLFLFCFMHVFVQLFGLRDNAVAHITRFAHRRSDLAIQV